jgi:hypothetical protein
MDCSICKDLERTHESRRNGYTEARCAGVLLGQQEDCGHKNVELERAKSN